MNNKTLVNYVVFTEIPVKYEINIEMSIISQGEFQRDLQKGFDRYIDPRNLLRK